MSMYFVSEFKIRLKGQPDRITVLKAVRRVASTLDFNLGQCNQISNKLLDGGTWEVIPRCLREDPRKALDRSTFEVMAVNDIEDAYELRRRENERIGTLIEAGANGDAAAAIEICQGLKDGRYVGYFGAWG